MKKYYVSIETAKMLKEKGYNEPCSYWYSRHGLLSSNLIAKKKNNTSNKVVLCTVPELYEVQQWLREAHDINISVMRATINYGDAISKDNILKYFWHIQEPYKQHKVDVGVYYTTYEQSLEEGINEALKII